MSQDSFKNTRPAFVRSIHPGTLLALSFLLVITLGTFFLSLPVSSAKEGSLSFMQALFTSVSATCVTGLSLIDAGQDLSRFGQVMLLLLIQTGGLGLMTLSTFFLLSMGRRTSLRERMILQSSFNEEGLQGLQKLTMRVVLLTFAMETMGALVLSLRFIPLYGVGEGLFRSFFHAISAFCNAGFDLFGGMQMFASDPLVTFTLGFLIIFGGLGFSVILDCLFFFFRKSARLSLHSRITLSMTLGLLLSGTVLFTLAEWNNPETLGNLPFYLRPMGGFFQSVTTRTAGFSMMEQASLTKGSYLITLLFMSIGASSASTGGGIKTGTMAVVLASLWATFLGKEKTVLFRRTIPTQTVQRAMALLFFTLFLLFFSLLLLGFFALKKEVSLLMLAYEAVSALSTTGLTQGITISIGVPAQFILMILMYLGRIGPMTLGLLLLQKQVHTVNRLEYPHGSVMIG